MTLKIESKKTAYLYDTPVENIFIAEYMPDMPGEYVKVYLCALMSAENSGEATDEEIARALHMSEDEVAKAFCFMEGLGLLETVGAVRRFRVMKEKLYGKKENGEGGPINLEENPDSIKAATKLLNNQEVAAMVQRVQSITGRFLAGGEQMAIISWIEDYNVNPDLVTAAYDYCHQRGKDNYRYVGKVVLSWAKEGLSTGEDAREYLSQRDKRYTEHRRIMRALGFNRNATEKELAYMDNWMDEMGCSMEEILDACGQTSKIDKPNFSYVDAVIRNRKGLSEKGAPHKVVMDYYEKLREDAMERVKMAKMQVIEMAPAYGELDREAAEISRDMTAELLGGDVHKMERIAKMKARITAIEEEKTRLLTENNIPIDFMTPRYRCRRCEDTGVLDDGSRCSCYEERAQEAAAQMRDKKA